MTNNLDQLSKFFKTLDIRDNSYNIIIQTLSIYNCRINEILNASWKNFFPNKYLILIGSKGSSNVIITDRILLNAINDLPRIDPVRIFPFITYYQVYHEIKKKYSHLLTQIKSNKNMKITHSFRYFNVAGIDNENFIKDILHHNSVKSGKYYKNKLKGS